MKTFVSMNYAILQHGDVTIHCNTTAISATGDRINLRIAVPLGDHDNDLLL